MDTQRVRVLYPFCGILLSMAIHIGSIIKNTLKSKNIDVTTFAKEINFTRSNAYKIFKKASIDTQLLFKINKVLGENLFFNYITDQEISDYKNAKIKPTEVLSAIKDLKSMVITISENNKAIKNNRLKVNSKRKKGK